jgi:hypothetical protein
MANMKLKQYLKQLNDLAKKHPEALEMDVVYSKDDEGNGFQHIYYAPNIGEFDGDDFDDESENKNAVCIN